MANEESEWNQHRAITALLDIAHDALQAAQAILPETAGRVCNAVYDARLKVNEAKKEISVWSLEKRSTHG